MAGLRAKTKKIITGIAGGIVLVAGIIMIPYPGPGWVVVFIGLSILSTEFDKARRIHDFAHAKYDAWQEWLARQPGPIKAIFWLLTAAVVVVTVWLVNGYGMMNDWLHLGQPWLHSPIMWFK